jgi:hypothetical protein
LQQQAAQSEVSGFDVLSVLKKLCKVGTVGLATVARELDAVAEASSSEPVAAVAVSATGRYAGRASFLKRANF